MASQTAADDFDNLWNATLHYVNSQEVVVQGGPVTYLLLTLARTEKDIWTIYSNAENQLFGLEYIPQFHSLQLEMFTHSRPRPPSFREEKELRICIVATARNRYNRIIHSADTRLRLKFKIAWILRADESLLPGWADTVEVLKFGVSAAFHGYRLGGWNTFQAPTSDRVEVRVTTG